MIFLSKHKILSPNQFGFQKTTLQKLFKLVQKKITNRQCREINGVISGIEANNVESLKVVY